MANPLVWIILLSVLVVAVLSLVPLFSRSANEPREDGWKGIFYVNPDDPALFVPKRYGIGWTLNFGNSWSWVVLALILIAAVLPLALALNTVRHPVRFR